MHVARNFITDRFGRGVESFLRGCGTHLFTITLQKNEDPRLGVIPRCHSHLLSFSALTPRFNVYLLKHFTLKQLTLFILSTYLLVAIMEFAASNLQLGTEKSFVKDYTSEDIESPFDNYANTDFVEYDEANDDSDYCEEAETFTTPPSLKRSSLKDRTYALVNYHLTVNLFTDSVMISTFLFRS